MESREKAYQEEFEKGREEGRLEAKLEIHRTFELLKKIPWMTDKEISRLTKVPVKLIRKWRSYLNEQPQISKTG